MNSQQLQPLPRPSQRKAGIVTVNGFAGVDAICLYALNNLDPAIEHSEVLELGDFLNRHISETRSACPEGGGDAADNLAVHDDDAPIDWHLSNFARYVKEHNVCQAELKLMMDVAIGIRAILRIGDKGHNA